MIWTTVWNSNSSLHMLFFHSFSIPENTPSCAPNQIIEIRVDGLPRSNPYQITHMNRMMKNEKFKFIFKRIRSIRQTHTSNVKRKYDVESIGLISYQFHIPKGLKCLARQCKVSIPILWKYFPSHRILWNILQSRQWNRGITTKDDSNPSDAVQSRRWYWISTTVKKNWYRMRAQTNKSNIHDVRFFPFKSFRATKYEFKSFDRPK